jgi:hypothetical protein
MVTEVMDWRARQRRRHNLPWPHHLPGYERHIRGTNRLALSDSTKIQDPERGSAFENPGPQFVFLLLRVAHARAPRVDVQAGMMTAIDAIARAVPGD